uniref:Glycine-rich domain-containing protein n=1 Tax=viral metagenome TaxID=1070528 RepID=A0A6C0KBJ4_9ZZZZ
MAIILVIVVIYYLQVYHTSILEKYDNSASGAVNPATLKFNTISDTTSATSTTAITATRDIFQGAKLDLVGSGSKAIADAIAADKSDTFTLRDCKVYFTDDIDGCDGQQDTTTKTCSYKLDGWKEFETYTDKNGGTQTYEKKVYTPSGSNTREIINAHLTTKCFKEFDNEGNGNARGFEYKQNALVSYDAKGTTNNGVLDANTFGGKKYTSIQFINSGNAGDNLTKVIDSICSIKYDPIANLVGKVFYKFIFDTNRNITAIQKVKFNEDQNGIDEIQKDALTDFASKGSHGLRFDNNGRLQVFVNEAAINATMNIYKFNYLTNICANAQIKDYRKFASQNVNITNFVSFNMKFGASKERIIDIRNLHLIEQEAKNRFSRKDGNINVNYNKEILEYIKGRQKKIIDDLTDASNARRDNYSGNIRARQREKDEATVRRNNFKNQSFTDIIGLTVNSQRIFDYARGYKNNVLDTIPISSGAEMYIVNSTDICFVFKNNERQDQKSYSFIVPLGKNYVCDILIVGGGGGGGDPHGGGGGAGQLVLIYQATLNGTYTIKVGNGGTGGVFESTPPTKGSDSVFSNSSTTVIAEGGGANTNNAIDKNGGSGAGGDAYNPGGGTAGGGTKNTTVDLFPGATVYSRGNNGGNQGGTNLRGGGGGGAGQEGQSGLFSIPGKGGDGLSGISEIGYDFQTNFGNFGRLEADGKYYFAGGGGGGNSTVLNNSKGGGGTGGIVGNYPANLGVSAIANTGSGGGGGGGGGEATGGAGGSGIVIIRIKNILPVPSITLTTTDNYYKQRPEMTISMPSSRIQTNILTSFVYLQAGFYRFRADIGINDAVNQNRNIIYGELVIYDESNLSGTQYNCKTVFKYKRYNNRNMPAHLIKYIQIPTNKFYKLAYTYYYYNNTAGNIDDNFNLYCKYLNTTSQVLEGTVPLTNPTNNDDLFARVQIEEINTSLNQYLFSGENIHTAYNNDTLKSLFSTISYDNNNSEALIAFLDKGGKINNAPIDYFKLNFLDSKIIEEQSKYDAEYNLLIAATNNNTTIASYTTLYNDIANINYSSLIPVDNLTLRTGASFVSIFGESKEIDYITDEKVENYNNLANPNFKKSVYVEALN